MLIKNNMKIEEILNEGYNQGMIQVYSEIYNTVEFVQALKPKVVVEIGTNQGGSFVCWALASQPDIMVSIDLPNANFGTEIIELERNKKLSSFNDNTHFISGDSQDALNLIKLEKALNGRKIDFLFIDGDHTEDGVTRDFFIYKNYVNEGGWIGFHDIKSTEFHHNNNCFVDVLWNKLEGTKIEYCDYTHDSCGIGLIQKNRQLKYNG
jgi:cephalosporin hydroxylase